MEEQILAEIITKALPAVSSTGALVLVGWILWLRNQDKRNGHANGDHDRLVKVETIVEGLRDDVTEIKADIKALCKN